MIPELVGKTFMYYGSVIWQLTPNMSDNTNKWLRIKSDKYGNTYLLAHPTDLPKFLHNVVICLSWKEFLNIIIQLTKDNDFESCFVR